MNPQKLQKRLESLKGWREQAFILALAERASPNACLFLESTGCAPQARQLAPLLDELWSLILKPGDEEADDERKADLSERLAALLPPEDTGQESYGAHPMRDVFALLEHALLAMVDAESGRALDASRLSLGTVTGFIEFAEGDGLSETALVRLFDQHPLVLRELSFQEELYDLLRTSQRPAVDAMMGLRTLARDDGVSNIGICLDE